MARRHGRRSVDPDAPVVDLDRVLADDLQIDLIGRQFWPDPDPTRAARTQDARRAPGRHQRPCADEPLFELLDQWRLELAERPLPALPTSPPANASRPTRAGHRRTSWRPVMAVAAAIAAVLVGSAAVGAADADPRSPLWPITQMVWPARAQSIESSQQIQLALDEARTALAAGRSRDAQLAIIRAEGELGKVEDLATRDSIRSTVNDLWAQSASAVAGGTRPAAPNGALEGAPAGAAVAIGTGGSAAGSTAGPGSATADPVGSAPAGAAGVAPATVLSPTASLAPSVAAVPSQSPSATSAVVVDPAAPVPVPSTASATPAPPATVPDPGSVVVTSSSSAALSSPPVATQQSAPTPSPTTESSGDTASVSARTSGTTGDGAQAPAADASPTSSSSVSASSG